MKKYTRQILLGLCLIGALRVFIYAGSFPFFNNVDEIAHVDLVVKYSRGEVPRELSNISLKAAELFVLYLSPEYSSYPSENFSQGFPPPRWEHGRPQLHPVDTSLVRVVSSNPNHEASSPPLYYGTAALWLQAGKLLFGKENDGYHLYWVRFMNVVVIVIVILLSFLCARELFPGQQHLNLSVAAVTALMPQDIFYTVQSDVFSPLLYGISFLYSMRFLKHEIPPIKMGLISGIALGCAMLAKLSNLPLILLMTAFVCAKIFKLSKTGRLKPAAPALIAFFASAWIPLAGLFIWNYYTFGDITASTDKAILLGWQPKPFGRWLDHPIFTTDGIAAFWTELMASFWRGELIYYTQRLAKGWMDVWYWSSSLLFLILAFMRRWSGHNLMLRAITSLSFLSLVFYLFVLSLAFDFTYGAYPSAGHPYFTSGRLMTGALIPFVLLYVRGYELAFKWVGNLHLRFLFLWISLIVITYFEADLSKPVFASIYNFFHM